MRNSYIVATYCTLPLHADCFWHHKRRNLTTKNLHQHQTACHPGKISYSVFQKKKNDEDVSKTEIDVLDCDVQETKTSAGYGGQNAKTGGNSLSKCCS